MAGASRARTCELRAARSSSLCAVVLLLVLPIGLVRRLRGRPTASVHGKFPLVQGTVPK